MLYDIVIGASIGGGVAAVCAWLHAKRVVDRKRQRFGLMSLEPLTAEQLRDLKECTVSNAKIVNASITTARSADLAIEAEKKHFSEGSLAERSGECA